MISCVLNDISKKYNLTPELAENNSQKIAIFLANWPRSGLTFTPISDRINHLEATYKFEKYLERLNVDYSANTFSSIEGCTFLMLNLFRFTAKHGLKIEKVIIGKAPQETPDAAYQRTSEKKTFLSFPTLAIPYGSPA